MVDNQKGKSIWKPSARWKDQVYKIYKKKLDEEDAIETERGGGGLFMRVSKYLAMAVSNYCYKFFIIWECNQ